ncbi:hypothetical protein [Oscillibacter sp. GMB15532]
MVDLKNYLDLSGKVAVITCAGSGLLRGIGRHCVEILVNPVFTIRKEH